MAYVFDHDTNSNKIVARYITIRIEQYINNLTPHSIMAAKPLTVACFCFENTNHNQYNCIIKK